MHNGYNAVVVDIFQIPNSVTKKVKLFLPVSSGKVDNRQLSY